VEIDGHNTIDSATRDIDNVIAIERGDREGFAQGSVLDAV
jgi:hypothetical protein